MRSQTFGLRVASVIFGLLALAQLTRVILQAGVMAGGHWVPLWASAVAFFIFGALSLWMWQLSRLK
jgi:hypothetical protein